MAAVLRQKENHQKSTNRPYVVSNLTKRRLGKILFPAIVGEVSKMLHLLSSFHTMFFEQQPTVKRQSKYLLRFWDLFSLKFPLLNSLESVTRSEFSTKKGNTRASYQYVLAAIFILKNRLCNRFLWFPGFKLALDFLDRLSLGQIALQYKRSGGKKIIGGNKLIDRKWYILFFKPL